MESNDLWEKNLSAKRAANTNGLIGTSEYPDLVLINSPLKDYGEHARTENFTLPTLGLAYIATAAEQAGFSVGLIDAEALGLRPDEVAEIANAARPRWVGLNLLAPTFPQSVAILRRLNPDIQVMLGGHQAKAMPQAILENRSIPRIDALILGEAETRVPILLKDIQLRVSLPQVFWRDGTAPVMPKIVSTDQTLLAPDINALPFVDRKFLIQDPYPDGDVLESALVASRGCPYDCSFCGAAVSANPDIKIRMRHASNIIGEIQALQKQYGISRVRFVDDLFLANRKAIAKTLRSFINSNLNIEWDATGRINILASAPDELIDLMRSSGCHEIALGIETGSDRLLRHIDKKITIAQVETVVVRLCSAGINIKGYFILGLPTETREEHYATVALIDRLREMTETTPGHFRCGAFEYRPYPGTPDWARLIGTGFSESDMLKYDAGDSKETDDIVFAPDRDEFNFSTGLQFGEVPVVEVRRTVSSIMKIQKIHEQTHNYGSRPVPKGRPQRGRAV